MTNYDVMYMYYICIAIVAFVFVGAFVEALACMSGAAFVAFVGFITVSCMKVFVDYIVEDF